MISSTTPSSDSSTHPFQDEPSGMLFGLPMPMTRVMGLRGESIRDGEVRLRMLFQPEQANSRGDVHGGAIATLLDCALASAVRSHDPAAFGVATIDLTLHYVASATGHLIATAQCERRGRSISFARGEARSEDGTLVALATGTFKLMPRNAGPGQSTA